MEGFSPTHLVAVPRLPPPMRKMTGDGVAMRAKPVVVTLVVDVVKEAASPAVVPVASFRASVCEAWR